MSKRRPSSRTTALRRALPAAAAIAIFAFVGLYAVVGPTGVLALGDYRRQVASREQQFAALDHDRAMLKNRVALLDPRHANPDLVDELVRKGLNVAHPDEVIVPLR